jgi:hypothetical protein
MTLRVAFLALAVLVAETCPARAEQLGDPEVPHLHRARPVEPELPPPRANAIYAVLGLGTPVGFFGFEGVHRFGAMEIAVGLGVGAAASGSEANPSLGHDLQWSVMPRFRIAGDDYFALTFGEGLSGGQYGNGVLDFCEEQPCWYPTSYVVWANTELALETFWSHVTSRYFLGLAVGCAVAACGSTLEDHQDVIPYLGVGLGYAF